MRHVEKYGSVIKLFLTDDDYVDFNVIFNKKHIYYISDKPRKPIVYTEPKKSDTRIMLETFLHQYQKEKEKIEKEEDNVKLREEQLNNRINSWLKGW